MQQKATELRKQADMKASSLISSFNKFKQNRRCSRCGRELKLESINKHKFRVLVQCSYSQSEGHTNQWFEPVEGNLVELFL